VPRNRAEADKDFTEFAVGAYPALLKTARLMTSDLHAAEDMVQNALERVYVRWHRHASWDSPHAYARQVLVNLVIKATKRKWHNEIAHAVPPERDAAGGVEHTAERRDLGVALRSLPAAQRVALVLRYYEDLSVEETARTLGCSAGTVKSRTNRALTALRTSGVLAEYDIGGGS